MQSIRIRGAREHNLKNIDVDLPRDSLVVITGLSGSGKSSLAFDTIYAEGQRRYVESLSAYARQFLELMQKPDVDSIEGLSPAISIEQKTTSRNPRSTVGTVTEIYDYLRLLFARVGVPYSPATGLPIESQTVSQMVDRIKTMAEGTRLYLMAPIARGRKGEYRKELQDLQKKGFQRVKIDGKLHEIAEAPALDKKYKHDIDVVVDRLVVRKDIGSRLADSFETALELADGIADPANPLTARVLVNRIWQHHFGRGIVETPSNFGQNGARPSNQELLDYLAARLVENQWSIKAIHREIMLSAVYALSTESIAANDAVDPDNRLLWRANWQRMDAETLRDSLLFVAGNLDLREGGPPEPLDLKNRRRAVYGFVSRRKLDPMLALFDFPNPNSTSEQRVITNVPLQRLFMMNSGFVEEQAAGLAKRVSAANSAVNSEDAVTQAYRLLYGRPPSREELQLGEEFVAKSTWKEYARVLLNANEFEWVN
jgi:hypothetical protein